MRCFASSVHISIIWMRNIYRIHMILSYLEYKSSHGFGDVDLICWWNGRSFCCVLPLCFVEMMSPRNNHYSQLKYRAMYLQSSIPRAEETQSSIWLRVLSTWGRCDARVDSHYTCEVKTDLLRIISVICARNIICNYDCMTLNKEWRMSQLLTSFSTWSNPCNASAVNMKYGCRQ